MFALLALGLLQAASPPVAAEKDRSPEPPRAAKPRTEDDDDEGERVDPNSPVVITARRLDAARTRIDAGLGATVYSLTNDAVEKRPGGETGSIAAILAQTPGASPTGNGLAIRGARTTQVRINDVIVPEAISDPAEHLSARLAETSRVMTGTLPAQFGFAPGGVIGVTTKSGAYQRGGQAELFAGTDGLVEPAVEWAGALGGVSLFGSGSYERERTRIADAAGRAASDLRRGVEGLVFADHVLSGSDRLSLIAGAARERHAFGATSIGAGSTASDDAYAVGTFQHSDGGFTLQASLFAGTSVDEARFGVTTRERRSSLGTQVDAAEQLGSAHVLRGGLLLTRSAVTERDGRGGRLAAHSTPLSLYAQDEWTLAPGLTFNPGVRAEWLRGASAGAAVEPRASLVWAPAGGFTAHAGYARYAAAAPLGEVRGGALPDERDDYYDAGLQRRLGAFTFGLDAYLRRVRNLLAEHRTPGEAAAATFAYRRADLSGVEASATYAQGPVTAWANLSVSRARGRSILGGGGLFAPQTLAAAASRWLPLADARPVVASGGLTWRFDELSLSADLLASSGAVRSRSAAEPNAARAPAFATFGLAAVYRVKLLERPADLRLDLTNLAGARYATSDATALEGGWTTRGRGRALTLGIEQGF
ncbi:MAG TPA: TonB-dependent receptor [Allosphingosinicella sp.]|nr:TonB-dependent receptor [Allosphingosinicella sp.]